METRLTVLALHVAETLHIPHRMVTLVSSSTPFQPKKPLACPSVRKLNMLAYKRKSLLSKFLGSKETECWDPSLAFLYNKLNIMTYRHLAKVFSN
jgi:hypothetical protein